MVKMLNILKSYVSSLNKTICCVKAIVIAKKKKNNEKMECIRMSEIDI